MKKITIVMISLGSLFVLGVLVFINLSYTALPYDKFNIIQRYAIKLLEKEMDDCVVKLPKEEQKVINYDEAMDCLDPLMKRFTTRILTINPAELGFKGPFFSREPADDLIRIEAREFDLGNVKIKTGINFLPRTVFEDYEKMNEAMKKDLGKGLFVNSGYRSPGYQAYLFLYYLGDENKYSLYENAKWIAMPGYSEHNSKNTAIDFISENGINGQAKGQTAEDFEKLPEYSWLVANAEKYNFYLTYPRDNSYGVGYESWHWHWEIKTPTPILSSN
jgi:LAS superfamily LD-carboxypeptidase LdcB